MFFYAGTANGKIDNGASSLEKYREYSPGMPTDLIVDHLDTAGVEWRIYRGSLMPWMRFFPSFMPDREDRADGQRRRDRRDEQKDRRDKQQDRRRRVKRYETFNNDCRQDDLPPVVFIDGNANAFRSRAGGFNNDDQAPADVARGQELVGDIYENLRKHGQLAETLFVVTYDEHGGFYDHLAPDALPKFATTKDPEFNSFGVRVPALAISPFVEQRSVATSQFDNASITHSILLRFCPNQGMSTRVAIAPNLGRLLTRTTGRPNLPSATAAVEAAKAARSGRQGNPDEASDVAADLLSALAL